MTDDLDRRWKEHQKGHASKFTRDADLDDIHPVVSVEQRRHALNIENSVTELLRSEFGRWSVTGGNDAKRKRQPVAEDDVAPPPGLAHALGRVVTRIIARVVPRQTKNAKETDITKPEVSAVDAIASNLEGIEDGELRTNIFFRHDKSKRSCEARC